MSTPDVGSGAGRTADAEPGRDQPDEDWPRRLADEQAALRRVATLVASGARPDEVFTAVADELGQLIGAEATFVSRVDLSGADSPGVPVADASGERAEPEAYITVAGSYGRIRDEVPVGFRVKLNPEMVMTAALRTGGPARVNGERLAEGPFGAIVGRLGLRAAVATPVVAGGRYWGVTVAATSEEDFPAGTESRMAEFMELAGMAIANAEAEQKLRELADTQASLRRVATLVAGGGRPDEVFTAVADELGGLIGAEATFVSRVDRPPAEPGEPEGYITVVASHGAVSDQVPVGFQLKLLPGMIHTTALQTGRPARISGEKLSKGPYGAWVASLGMRAGLATPIVVGGRQWGVMVAATSRQDFPADTETRMAEFIELVATAIANAQSEQNLRGLADTQASLRRLAMLVARGEPPEALFAAVTKEVQRYFGGGTARMIRYEVDGTATLLANAGTESHVRVGERWEGYPPTGLTVTVRRTGRAARIDDYRDVPDAEVRLREGILSSVALPIHVNGQLWGMIAVGSGQASLPPDTEQRMTEFTELVATAVANAQSRAELITSRARIVAASDEVRRRIERDLHDGAQQRLVTLALRLRSAAEPPSGRAELGTEIAGVAAELMGVIDDLREISRGIHPAILSKAGLRPALRALGRRSAVPVELDVRVDGRLPEPVEVGAYYVVSEMLANAAKHARASMIQVDAEASGGTLRVRVHDDGIGGATPAGGSGLLGLKDRIEALGGTFSVHSPAGRGTTVSCQLPVTADGEHPDADRGGPPIAGG